MAMLALSALGPLLGGGTAAVAGAAGGASILSGIATATSAISALAAGSGEAAGYRAQATQAQFDQRQEQIDGVQRTSKLKQMLAQSLGENDVAFASAGVDLTGGIAADARTDLEKAATREMQIDQSTTDARRAMLKNRSANYIRMASSATAGGVLNALGIVTGNALKNALTGGPAAPATGGL